MEGSLAVQTSLLHIPRSFVPRGFMLVLDLHWPMQKQSGKWKSGSQWAVQSLLKSGKGEEASEGSIAR